jgi:hypothetical protein
MLATGMPICASQTHVHSGVRWCGQVTEIVLNRGATRGPVTSRERHSWILGRNFAKVLKAARYSACRTKRRVNGDREWSQYLALIVPSPNSS